MLSLFTSLLTTDELTTASARLAPLWTPLFATEPLLTTISAAADANRTAILEASTREITSGFTAALKDADAARDTAFTSLRDLAATAARNPVATAEQRAAGARLEATFIRHGTMLHRLGYARQTGKMQSLLIDLRTPEATADLALVGLTTLFTHLGETQQHFEQIVADKAAAEGGETLPTVSAHRPLLERRLNHLLDALAEWNTLAPTPTLTTALGEIEEVIQTIMAPALARRTRAENTAAPIPPTPPATPRA